MPKKGQPGAMSSNISWANPVEFILVSFVPENELPLAPIRTFYATVVERLEICGKEQLFDALKFAKNPSKLLVMRNTHDEEIEKMFGNLIDSAEKSNILYVLCLHKPDDEQRILELAKVLLSENKFAVAAFSKSYAECIKHNKAVAYQQRSQEIQNISRQLLYDIVRVIMHRKSAMNEKLDDSFTGANDLFSDDDDQETVFLTANEENSRNTRCESIKNGEKQRKMKKNDEIEKEYPKNRNNVTINSKKIAQKPAETLVFDVVPSFSPLMLNPGELYDVVVSHVTDKGDIFAQFCAHCKFLEYLTFRMNMHYAVLDDKDTMLSYEKVRQSANITEVWCAAPFSFDTLTPNGKQCYFRAKLLSRVSTVIYEVQFVDYGNVARVPFSVLKTLPDSFRPVAGLAVHCQLKERGVDWRLLRQKLECCAPGSWCVLRIDNMDSTPYLVTLLLTDGYSEENVGEVLLREQLQRKTSSDSGPNNLSAGRGRRKSGSRT